ncbi:bestrophin homolog 1 isoform X2 [Lutzomyia longipalpis]|uniref:bestrophin homolog 1 isoform X2 n=1 Tax=Lutzomyia longipalpis TaxID=7200 RepID=UPI002483C14F|nr:bestrophin homolog 1 isoform X2 [Lutzomyia longipalpis]
MTISYTSEVPNGSSFGCFWRILKKWRGSVYKLVWRELLAYLGIYYAINLLYRYGLNDDQKSMMHKIQIYFYHNFRTFEKVRQYFGAQSESIPMSFVLGFYVSLVVKRWWEQYKLLPWPDTLALFISAAIPGNDEKGRLMRRNIMRYACLAYVITLQRISLRVKRRFPTLQHIMDAGLMLESEKKIFEIMNQKSPMSKYWMPLVWATNIINRARKGGEIKSDHIVQTLLVELSDIRRRLGALIGYDTVCVPLVYTQVVTLVLYSYFVAALVGRQMVPHVDGVVGKYEDPDLYFPLFTALQFCFYVGWLKVAEVLINPFGEDDDDIELNWLIDRHIKASYMIVDEMHEEHPELLKDQYWGEVVPKDLPYTQGSEHYRRHEPKGSAENYKVKPTDALYANIVPSKNRHLPDDVYADYESVDTPMVERRKNWFSRQITRMGSARSSSTAYSSGGLISRNRQNSVYSSPEAALGQQVPNHPSQQKMSFYEKLVGRKSGRSGKQLIKQSSKLSLNGVVATNVPLRNRPRIPTPDVTKEVMDRESRFAIAMTSASSNNQPSVASGVALMAQQLATTPSMYSPPMNSDVSVAGTLFLSPIKELESASVNSSLNIGNPATAALAKSILASNLQQSGASPYNNANVSNITEITPFGGEEEAGHSADLVPSTASTVVYPTTLANTESTVKVETLPRSLSKSSSNVITTDLVETELDSVDTSMKRTTLSRESSNATTNSTHSALDTFTGTIAGLFKPAGSIRSKGKVKSDSKTGEVYV